MMSKIQQQLREQGKVVFEGVQFQYVGEWDTLEPGDTYMAERNAGPKLLTVLVVKEGLGDCDQYAGAVFAKEAAYPYDLGECVKVRMID